MVVGPLIALAALGGLAVILRWAFLTERRPTWAVPYSGGHRRGRRTTEAVDPYGWEQITAPRDYGLLEDVAVVDGPAAADVLRDALAAVNIRTTVVIEADGRVRVLVFNDELDHARRVLG